MVVDFCEDDKDDSWQQKEVKEQDKPFARVKITIADFSMGVNRRRELSWMLQKILLRLCLRLGRVAFSIVHCTYLSWQILTNLQQTSPPIVSTHESSQTQCGLTIEFSYISLVN